MASGQCALAAPRLNNGRSHPRLSAVVYTAQNTKACSDAYPQIFDITAEAGGIPAVYDEAEIARLPQLQNLTAELATMTTKCDPQSPEHRSRVHANAFNWHQSARPQ